MGKFVFSVFVFVKLFFWFSDKAYRAFFHAFIISHGVGLRGFPFIYIGVIPGARPLAA